MNESLERLTHLLDLRWNAAKVAAALSPFRLTHQLAEGSMALVFEATNDESGETVIIKVPSPVEFVKRVEHDLSTRLEALQYEADWLERVARCNVPGIVRPIANRTSGPFPYLVLDKLGQTADVMLDAPEGGETNDCLTLLHDIAATLEKLHARGIYHYDVKPDNIVQGHEGWTLIDPCPDSHNTHDYFDSRIARGPERDVFALGRAFLQLYCGYIGEIDILPGDGWDNEEIPKLFHLIRRVLGRTRYSIPSATFVRRVVHRALIEDFGVEL